MNKYSGVVLAGWEGSCPPPYAHGCNAATMIPESIVGSRVKFMPYFTGRLNKFNINFGSHLPFGRGNATFNIIEILLK